MRTDDTPLLWHTVDGSQIVTWNTNPDMHIAAQPTQPILAMAQPRPSLRQPLEVLYLD